MKILSITFLVISANFFSQTKSGNWTLNKNEYTNVKSISVPASRNGTYCARIKMKGAGDVYTWNLFTPEENFLYWTREPYILSVYVKINGSNKEFTTFYGNPMILTKELKEAFQQGTEVAIKADNNPDFFKFSLTGITKAMEWLVVKP